MSGFTAPIRSQLRTLTPSHTTAWFSTTTTHRRCAHPPDPPSWPANTPYIQVNNIARLRIWYTQVCSAKEKALKSVFYADIVNYRVVKTRNYNILNSFEKVSKTNIDYSLRLCILLHILCIYDLNRRYRKHTAYSRFYRVFILISKGWLYRKPKT